jgi:thioredoxin 1
MIKLLDFWAQWCGPCRLMNPIIEELAKDYEVDKIEVDNHPELAKTYNIKAIPTFVVEKDGEEVDRIVGGVSKEKLIEILEKHNGE